MLSAEAAGNRGDLMRSFPKDVQPSGTRVSSLADWWHMPPSGGGTVTKEQYERGERPWKRGKP